MATSWSPDCCTAWEQGGAPRGKFGAPAVDLYTRGASRAYLRLTRDPPDFHPPSAGCLVPLAPRRTRPARYVSFAAVALVFLMAALTPLLSGCRNDAALSFTLSTHAFFLFVRSSRAKCVYTLEFADADSLPAQGRVDHLE